MKKRSKFLALFLAAALTFSVSACGSKDADNSKTDDKAASAEQGSDNTEEKSAADILAAAQEKMKNVKSMNAKMIVDMNMEASAEGESQSMQMTTTADMSCFYDPVHFKIDMTMNAGEAGTTSTTMYAEADDSGKYTQYITDGTNWQAQEIDLSAIKQYNASDNMNQYIDESYNYKSEGTEEINGANAYKLSGIITGDNLKETMLASGSLDSLTSLGIDSAQVQSMIDGLGDLPITLWIDEASMYPVKYEMDMSAVMNSLMTKVMESMGDETAGASINFSKVMFSMVCSDFNAAAEFTIPDEAKAAAPAA